MDIEERAARHSRGGRQNLTREQLLDLLDGHEAMRWPEEAHRLQQERNAALAEIARLRAGIERVATLGESWVGFDSSHHYGDAVLKALSPALLGGVW